MCGIAGIFHFDRQQTADAEKLKQMADVIAHRGPDGEGYYVYQQVGLAHRRLSIIDLSTGAQPMYSDDKQLVIVFNGEIYNYIELQQELQELGHQFRTSSDTEVILRAYEQWGLACQEKFNGMWAFALWDERRQHLFISRDRVGEKPLHYGVFDNTFLFGSEIKCLGAYGAGLRPDLELLEVYLFLGYIPEPFTFYKGIKKLSAGHYLIVKGETAREYCYWELPEMDEQDLRRDPTEAVREFKTLFYDAVRLRMRSDVAYGAFLSGGLDSSSIVAVMSETSSRPVETFTIGFNEKRYDEREMARLVAARFQTSHHEQVVERDTLEQALANILFHYDEPFADPAAIPTGIVSKYASREVKMVLTGDGADEVLAGYSAYQGEHLAGKFRQLPGVLRNVLPKIPNFASGMLSGHLRYQANRATRVLENFNAPFQERLISKSVKIPQLVMKSLHRGSGLPIEAFMEDVFAKVHFRDPFYLLMYYHLKVSLPGQMLVKVDRMSMAHSIETRAPFLDHRLVGQMYRVSKKVKMPDHQSVKQVLKTAMKNVLPEEIISRRKKGFDVPLREWFRDKAFSEKLDQDFDQYGLNGEVIRNLFAENKNGKADHGTLIWRLLLYTNWMKQF